MGRVAVFFSGLIRHFVEQLHKLIQGDSNHLTAPLASGIFCYEVTKRHDQQQWVSRKQLPPKNFFRKSLLNRNDPASQNFIAFVF